MTFQIFCATLIALAFGVAVAFRGYRFFLVLLPILGFVIGFTLGAQTLQAIFDVGFLTTVTSWVVGFLVGLLFGVLSYLFYFIGVALLSFGLGYAIGAGFMGLIGFDLGLVSWLVGMVAGVAIRVVLERLGTVGLLQPGLVGAPRDTQDFVVVAPRQWKGLGGQR